MQKINHNAAMELLKSLQQLLDYSGGLNPIYVGKAHAGAATTAAVWQIKKIAYDGSGNVTSIKFAGKTPNPDSIWDNRASLTYA